jgi:hypothetical protein
MAGKKRAEDMSLEDLEDGFDTAELAEIYDEPADDGDDSDLIPGWLYLTREGFEDYELANQKPYIDFADFGDYVADQITEDLFGWVKNETLLDGVADEIKGQALDFANGSLVQAMAGIGGFGWFESIDLDYSYSPTVGTLSISLESLLKSPVDHGVMNKTEFAPLDQPVEAKKTASSDEIEIDGNDVKMHADVDDGEGNLEEWIYDALEERLRLDGREDEIGGLDAVAKEVADECGNSLDGFKGSLKVSLSDDGLGIKSFEYDGETHGLDDETVASVK